MEFDDQRRQPPSMPARRGARRRQGHGGHAPGRLGQRHADRRPRPRTWASGPASSVPAAPSGPPGPTRRSPAGSSSSATRTATATRARRTTAATYALRFKSAYDAMHATNPAMGLLAQADDGNCGCDTWVSAMHTAVPNLGSMVAGWTVHPYGPVSRWKPRIDRLISQTAAQGWSSEHSDRHHRVGHLDRQRREPRATTTTGPRTRPTRRPAPTSRSRSTPCSPSALASRLRVFTYFQGHDQLPSGTGQRERYFGVMKNDGSAKGALTTAVIAQADAHPAHSDRLLAIRAVKSCSGGVDKGGVGRSGPHRQEAPTGPRLPSPPEGIRLVPSADATSPCQNHDPRALRPGGRGRHGRSGFSGGDRDLPGPRRGLRLRRGRRRPGGRRLRQREQRHHHRPAHRGRALRARPPHGPPLRGRDHPGLAHPSAPPGP